MALLLAGSSTKSFDPHFHSVYEIIICKEGAGIILIDEKKYPVHPGSILVVPPKAIHQGVWNSPFCELYFWSDEPIHAVGENEAVPILLEDDGKGTLTQLFEMLLHRFAERDKNDFTMSLLFELIMRLLAEKCIAKRMDPVVESVRHYLVLNYQDPELSLEDVLTMSGYQKDHIRRKFSAAYGVTPSAYLTNLRIESAKRLLCQKKKLGLSISEIAAMCGYYDGQYFSRVFKKCVGVSPKKYMDAETSSSFST